MNPLTIFSMLSPRAWLESGVIFAFALFVGWAVHHERDVGREEVRVQWAQEHARELAAADAERQRNEAESTRRAQAIQEIRNDAQLQVLSARADAASAADAADRLRQRFAAAARRGATAGDPVAARGSAPASAPGDVLSDVFSRAVDVAQQLAATADQSRVAGLACERSFDQLTKGTP